MLLRWPAPTSRALPGTPSRSLALNSIFLSLHLLKAMPALDEVITSPFEPPAGWERERAHRRSRCHSKLEGPCLLQTLLNVYMTLIPPGDVLCTVEKKHGLLRGLFARSFSSGTPTRTERVERRVEEPIKI